MDDELDAILFDGPSEPRIALPYGWRRTPLPMSEDEADYRADHAPEPWESADE